MTILEKAQAAAAVLEPILKKTPCILAPLDIEASQLYLKAENLQLTGSFKLRGAYYKCTTLSPDQKDRGVICASAGNHAQGVAYAAQAMGLEATIVMPTAAPLSKIEATRHYGANVVLAGDSFDEAYQTALALREETGATFIEPFNDEEIIAGQGTLGLEILDQIENLDVLLVPIGGGGLAAGVSAVVKALRPQCEIIGVQAQQAGSMAESFAQNRIVSLPDAVTMADGIAVKTPGNLTYEICRRHVDRIVTVDEQEIAGAILWLLEKTKLVAEGAGAVALAAALYRKIECRNKTIAAILSGGNIDVTMIARILEQGLGKTGRRLSFGTLVSDKPGQLLELLGLVKDLNANIVQIEHNRTHHRAAVGSCYVKLAVETADHNHIQIILKELHDHGYQVHPED